MSSSFLWAVEDSVGTRGLRLRRLGTLSSASLPSPNVELLLESLSFLFVLRFSFAWCSAETLSLNSSLSLSLTETFVAAL